MLHFEKFEKLSGDKNGKMCVFESIFIDFREMSEKTCGFYRRFRGPKLAVILGNVWSTSPSSSTTNVEVLSDAKNKKNSKIYANVSIFKKMLK